MAVLFFNNLEEVKIHLNDRQDFGSCESKNGVIVSIKVLRSDLSN
jgi:hypothetical protein